MFHLYGIIAAGAAPPALTGLAGQTVVILGCDALAVVASLLEAPLAATPDAVRGHEQVIAAVMADTTILPLRFATMVEDVAALHRLLLPRQTHLLDRLAKLGGQVELAVRVAGVAPPPAPRAEGPGARYLHRITARHAAWPEALRASLQAALPGIPVQFWPGADILRASALVTRDAVAASCAAVDGFAAAWPALDITCTGPWPPWSFVEDPNDG